MNTAKESPVEFINVSNRLPVSVDREHQSLHKSSGGLVSAFEDITQEYSMKWIGWPGEAPEEGPEREAFEKLLKDEGYVPVFLSDEQVDDYYHKFSNSSIWPLFHYFGPYASYERKWYKTYQEVNQHFAKVIAEVASPGSIVWVHDYHLMLVPQYLRELRDDLKIGFFLHTPFPSFEIFRCHPDCREILKGLLGADLIGFHTFGYLRHFRSSLLRIAGLDSEIDSVHHDHRRVEIGVFPIGISWKRFSGVLQSEDFQNKMTEFKKTYQGKKVVLSVERLDYSKGIPEKLAAIEKYLQDHPETRDSVVFVQIAIPSREKVEWNHHVEEKVVKQVSYINGKYSSINNIPVQFIFQSVSMPELCALYCIADVALVTPLMDGMNLVAKEYIACQQEKSGVLILSQFAGAAQELFNAININPYDADTLAEQIDYALNIKPEEAQAMSQSMRKTVIENSSEHWACKFLLQLSHAEQPKAAALSNVMDQSDWQRICDAKNMAIFLDYDGTLREFETSPSAASPTEEIRELLKNLTQAPNKDVFIISGRKREDLGAWFEGLPCTLIAEHGFCWREAGSDTWQDLAQGIDFHWKQEILKIFDHFTLSTPGSFIEEKSTSLVWHYRKSDPEFGGWKARLLMGMLYEMTANMPLQIQQGKKVVEVCSQHVNKGEALKSMIAGKDYDVVLCAGDDITDEHMFKVECDELITMKIGSGESEALYRFSTPALFRQFLWSLP